MNIYHTDSTRRIYTDTRDALTLAQEHLAELQRAFQHAEAHMQTMQDKGYGPGEAEESAERFLLRFRDLRASTGTAGF